ncbi:hypothetical protein EKH55_0078 [Sinorhizobium alkalisoli]|nr:hypothetical protein EKH55_0078 [Sinorhizobium alkalisoli]
MSPLGRMMGTVARAFGGGWTPSAATKGSSSDRLASRLFDLPEPPIHRTGRFRRLTAK